LRAAEREREIESAVLSKRAREGERESGLYGRRWRKEERERDFYGRTGAFSPVFFSVV
jgi:hypothetical protein